MMLEVAELAYPHWVALVGAEPPDPDTRMYFVCANDGNQMIEAMKSDVGMGTAGGFGGGITIWNNHSAYNYPSGTLLYHQRALVIHENLHMLQMIVYGSAGSEDFTYSGEQHVYDPAKKQLTVMCLDKAPTNNWTDVGLAALRKDFVPMPKAADALWSAGGGTGRRLPAVPLARSRPLAEVVHLARRILRRATGSRTELAADGRHLRSARQTERRLGAAGSSRRAIRSISSIGDGNRRATPCSPMVSLGTPSIGRRPI